MAATNKDLLNCSPCANWINTTKTEWLLPVEYTEMDKILFIVLAKNKIDKSRLCGWLRHTLILQDLRFEIYEKFGFKKLTHRKNTPSENCCSEKCLPPPEKCALEKCPPKKCPSFPFEYCLWESCALKKIYPWRILPSPPLPKVFWYFLQCIWLYTSHVIFPFSCLFMHRTAT